MPVLEIESVRSQLEPFLKDLLRLARCNVKFEILPANRRDGEQGAEQGAEDDGPEILVDFSGPEIDLLLQRGGEFLLALEYVATKVLRLPPEERGRIEFDCNDYRSLRVGELRLTAATAAERVTRTGEPFALNPMDSRERRIVHLALRDNPSVRTESQGGGPYRKVVIFPADKK
jgi:spoIIIJ-associated protein